MLPLWISAQASSSARLAAISALAVEAGLLREAMQSLLQLYVQGQINPVIAHTFPLAAAPAAHRYLQERRNIGKVLLTIDA